MAPATGKVLLMETLEQAGARPLLIVGGNLALDFANTVDDPGGPADFDHLGDAGRSIAWAPALRAARTVGR